MFDGDMILALILEQSFCTLGELVGLTTNTKEVAVIHNVCHWTLTILNTNLEHKLHHICMEQSTILVMQ